MFPKKEKRRKNPPIKRTGSKGFSEGLNTLAHQSMLKDTELSELINGAYSQYGTISKRLGTKIIGQESSGATQIDQMQGTYNIDGETRLIRISNSGIPEYYVFSTDQWEPLADTAPVGYAGTNPEFTDGVPTFDVTGITWIVQYQNRIYFANEVNELVWLDEDGWHIYTALANPTTKPTVAKTGSATGTTRYFYQYVWYNEGGGTEASDPAIVGTDASGTGWFDAMPQVLNDTTYLTLTLPAAPAGTTRVGIFRSNRQGEAFFLDEVAANQTTYVDKGELGTDTFYGVPESNTTGGYHFKLLDTYRSSLVGVATELGGDTLVWSAPPSSNWAIGDWGLPNGAGFFPYRKGEGTEINAIQPHVASNEDSLFVFKDNVFGKFRFLVEAGEFGGEGTVQDVNISIGSVAPLSPHIAGNNLRFWSKDGASTVGNEANYSTILRYSVLSLKADSIVQRVNPANLNRVCGEFHKHNSLFGISLDSPGLGNNAILAYDERYNAWSLWTGVYPKVFAKFINPTTKEEKLYYGSTLDANVLEMFSGKTDYRTSSGTGERITLSISTKQYDANVLDRFKKYDRAVMVFGTLTGNNTTVGISKADHRGVRNDPRLRISQEALLSGFGNDEWGNQEIGMMRDEDPGLDINIRYVTLRQKDMFWVKLNLQNDGISDEISLIGIYLYYSESSRPLPFNMKLRQLASTT